MELDIWKVKYDCLKRFNNDRIRHGYRGDSDLKIKGLIWFDDIIEKIKRKYNVQLYEKT